MPLGALSTILAKCPVPAQPDRRRRTAQLLGLLWDYYGPGKNRGKLGGARFARPGGAAPLGRALPELRGAWDNKRVTSVSCLPAAAALRCRVPACRRSDGAGVEEAAGGARATVARACAGSDRGTDGALSTILAKGPSGPLARFWLSAPRGP